MWTCLLCLQPHATGPSVSCWRTVKTFACKPSHKKTTPPKKKKLCVLECCSYSSFCLSGQTCLAFRSLLAHSTTHSLFFLDKVVKLVTSLLIGWLLSPTVFAVIRFSLALSPSISRFSGWARLQGEGRFGMMISQRKNADNRSQ